MKLVFNNKEKKVSFLKKSINKVFGSLFKSKEQELDKIKRLLIAVLEKNAREQEGLQVKKSQPVPELTLMKGKGYPIGTVREWKGKKYKKITSTKWMRYYKGEAGSRGMNQAIANVKKKIENAKDIHELAEIVAQNKVRFQDQDGKMHPVVIQLLEIAKEKGGKKKSVFQKKEEPVEKKERKERSDKGKKRESYTMTEEEKKVQIETDTKQLETAISIDEQIAKGEDVSELRNGENYYNEKPSEILNTGKEVYGAARHKFDTFEPTSENLDQMEKDGVAEKMITKGNLLQEQSIDEFKNRVENGESPSRVLLENVVYKLMKNAPTDNPKNRQKYAELCRNMNRVMAEKGSAAELFAGLMEVFSEYGNAGIMTGDSMGTRDAYDIVGKGILALLFTKKFKHLLGGYYGRRIDKVNKDTVTMIKETLGVLGENLSSGKEIDETKAKEIIKGKKSVLESKGLDKITKGDQVSLKNVEQYYRVKTSHESPEKKEEHAKKIAELNEIVEKEYQEYAQKTMEQYKDDPEVIKHFGYYDDIAKNYSDRFKERYTKKDGTLSKIALKRFGSQEGFNEQLQVYVDQATENKMNFVLKKKTGEQFYYKSKDIRRMMGDRRKILDEQYLIKTKIPLVSDKFVVSKAGKDTFNVVLTFEDGTKMEKRFNYSEVENVNKSTKTTRGKKKKIDLYVETKATRKGGDNKFESMNVVDIQKELHETYKIKSTTFGNSMPDKEREFHLRKTAESFADLSDILGLDENVVSANGKLGVSFGAFGGLIEGGALAVYKPDQKLIALTRKKGFGSFAHEWMHFIDHSLGSGGVNSFMSSGTGVLKKVNKVPEVIPNGSILTVEKKGRTGKITTTRYYYDKGTPGVDDYKKRVYPFVKLEKGQTVPGENNSRYSYGTHSLKSMIESDYYGKNNTLEIPDDTNKSTGVLMKDYMSTIVTEMQTDLKESEEVFRNEHSDMPKEEMDEYMKTIFHNGYYADSAECMARAFEVYVSDKMEKLNRENTYLASQKKTQQDDGSYIYPQKSKRREKIYMMFEAIFQEMRETGSLKKAMESFFSDKKKLVFFK